MLQLNRRRYLLAAGSAVGLAAAQDLQAKMSCLHRTSPTNHPKTFKLGLIADLHFGLEPTAEERLRTFMGRVDEEQPDAILQLGDFNYGDAASRPCNELWSQYAGPRYHVLGNHDMDRSSKQQMVELWEMPDRYYSFDAGGIHFVVLDRNNLLIDGKYSHYDKGNYYKPEVHRGHADPEQIEWLREDLSRNQLPTIVFSHQGLGMPEQSRGPTELGRQSAIEPIEETLAAANQSTNNGPVVACFCGHHHIDRYHLKDGIHYVWINSISYYWVGEAYGRMAAYRDPLYCFLNIAPTGDIEIVGTSTDWMAPSPAERGYPKADQLNTHILDRKLVAVRE